MTAMRISMNAIQDISAVAVTVKTPQVVFSAPVLLLCTVFSVSLMRTSVF